MHFKTVTIIKTETLKPPKPPYKKHPIPFIKNSKNKVQSQNDEINNFMQ